MIITETFCDKAFKDIRFNKKNMESALSLVRTNWVSKLYAYNPNEVHIVSSLIDTVFRVMYCRKKWDSFDIHTKKSILGFLFRNKRLFLDLKAFSWKNIEDYWAFNSIGNSYWNVDIRN